MELTALLTQRLGLIHHWYAGMVNAETGMLEYLYLPVSDAFLRERSPIRDIASVWDLALLDRFLGQDAFRPVIAASIRHYSGYPVARDGYRILDPRRLREPSSIAHSTFMLLALLHGPSPDREAIAGLAEGILHQQRPDGSYKVYFEDLPDEGEELYAGEAMLGLVEAHRRWPEARYVESVERAAAYYDALYFQAGRVDDALLVFFANWQSQACKALFECTPRAESRQPLADYVCRMHDRLIDRGFYEAVARHPARQASVEVACALEGLNEAYALARATGDARADRYGRCLCTGLAYLLGLQCTEGCTARERGGFGMSLDDRTQRIDVTGHAASAFMKSVENGLACP